MTLLCDGGERYLETLYDPAWLAERGVNPSASLETVRGLSAVPDDAAL